MGDEEKKIKLLKKIAKPLIEEMVKLYGETEYQYYAIPISYSRGQHERPITSLERYEITKEKYEENEAIGKWVRHKAFMGTLKDSYISYEKRVSKAGWREKLIGLLEEKKI